MRDPFATLSRLLKVDQKRLFDGLLLVAYFGCLIFFVLATKPGLLLGHFLYFVLPGAYLVWRYRRIRAHAFLTSIVFGITAGTLLQIVAELNDMWGYRPALPFLQFAGYPLEAIFWYIVWSGFAISVYAAFFDPEKDKKTVRHSLIKHHGYFLLFGLLVVCSSVALLLLYPSLFIVEHAYIVFGIPVVIVPMFLIFYYRPHVFRQIFFGAVVLSAFAIIYEVVGLKVGWWDFPGSYVARVSVMDVSIPLEELILWVGFGSLTVLAWYEEIEAE